MSDQPGDTGVWGIICKGPLTSSSPFNSRAPPVMQETIDALSHSGSLPLSIVIVNVAEESQGEEDTRLQV